MFALRSNQRHTTFTKANAEYVQRKETMHVFHNKLAMMLLKLLISSLRACLSTMNRRMDANSVHEMKSAARHKVNAHTKLIHRILNTMRKIINVSLAQAIIAPQRNFVKEIEYANVSKANQVKISIAIINLWQQRVSWVRPHLAKPLRISLRYCKLDLTMRQSLIRLSATKV